MEEYVNGIIRGKNQWVFSFFLFLLSIVYGFIQRVRVLLYRKGLFKVEKIGSKVISVGNITLGGTGKTPAVMAIAQMGKEKSFKVTILTRGYKGKAEGINVVSDGSRILLNCEDAGDEPYLMAKKLNGIPVVKGKNRYLSARFAIKRFGSDLFILDDGFQHLKIHRDVNILLIDATDPFGNNRIFPGGTLREPLTAIGRADIIVLTKSDLSQKNAETIKKIREYNPSAPIFTSYYYLIDLVDMKGDIMPVKGIKGRSLFIFSGLANHSSFRSIIEREGARVKGELTYPDHFYYSESDMKEIKKKSESAGADMIVTTEKDIVRIPYPGVDPETSSGKVWALRIGFTVEDREGWESILFQKGPIGGDT